MRARSRPFHHDDQPVRPRHPHTLRYIPHMASSY
jgi:hypothetical protein